MKQIVAAIYTNFRSSIVDDQGMEQTDGYTARPTSDRLILRFDPVHGKSLFSIENRVRMPGIHL